MAKVAQLSSEAFAVENDAAAVDSAVNEMESLVQRLN
jgi:hypothetical protein